MADSFIGKISALFISQHSSYIFLIHIHSFPIFIYLPFLYVFLASFDAFPIHKCSNPSFMSFSPIFPLCDICWRHPSELKSGAAQWGEELPQMLPPIRLDRPRLLLLTLLPSSSLTLAMFSHSIPIPNPAGGSFLCLWAFGCMLASPSKFPSIPAFAHKAQIILLPSPPFSSFIPSFY
jgi:hypothetical protein